MKSKLQWANEFCNKNVINVRGTEVQDFIEAIQKDAQAELVKALFFYAMAWRSESKQLISAPEYNDGHERLVGVKISYWPSNELMEDCGNKAVNILKQIGEL